MTGTPVSAGAVISRWATIGIVSMFAVGAIVGLVVGLDANPSTAWFAVFEAGIPAALLGGIVGILIGTVVYAVRRHRAG